MDFALEGRKSIAAHLTLFATSQLCDINPETNIYYTLAMLFLFKISGTVLKIPAGVWGLETSDSAALRPLSTYQTTPIDIPGSG